MCVRHAYNKSFTRFGFDGGAMASTWITKPGEHAVDVVTT